MMIEREEGQGPWLDERRYAVFEGWGGQMGVGFVWIMEDWIRAVVVGGEWVRD